MNINNCTFFGNEGPKYVFAKIANNPPYHEVVDRHLGLPGKDSLENCMQVLLFFQKMVNFRSVVGFLK
jgi:hypothetical protein